MHCFRAVFSPFSLWSEPQFPVMHHFLGKCTPFAAPSRPPPHPRKTGPRPLKLCAGVPSKNCTKSAQSDTSDAAVVPVPRITALPARQHFHVNAYKISGELSYNSTNDNAADGLQSGLLQRRQQQSFFTLRLSTHPKSGMHIANANSLTFGVETGKIPSGCMTAFS